MSRLRVTSAGVVCACGSGVESFARALADDDFPLALGHASTRWLVRRYGVGLVQNLEGLGRQELAGFDLRRVDRVGILALLAAREAVARAGLEPPLGEATGLVLASAHGAIGFSVEYHQAAVDRGAAGLSALLFSSSLLSSAAGAVALALGIRGPVHSLAAAATAAADALDLAGLLLESGDVERVLVVGAEMFHSVYLDAYDALFRLHARFGRPPDRVRAFSFAEGGAAILVNRAAEGGIGAITGIAGTGHGRGWDEPLAPRLAAAWQKAGLEPKVADLFLPGANHTFLDRLERDALAAADQGAAGPALALKTRTGEGFAFTSLLQVLAGLQRVGPGERALIHGVHLDGAVSAVSLEGRGEGAPR